MTLLFFLGREHALSRAELEVVIPRVTGHVPNFTEISPGILSVSLEQADAAVAQKLMDIVGGIIKIGEFLTKTESKEAEKLEQALIELLSTTPTGTKITFSVAEHGRNHVDAIHLPTVKKALTKQGFSVRFIETSREGAEAGLLLDEKMSEYHFIHTETGTIIAKTLAVQNVHAWSDRDMNKPYRDKKKGIIPPKLGRIMVNLAAGEKNTEHLRVYDPFCGGGTILLEAQLMGMRVAGSDLDAEAVHGAGENMAWLKEHFQLTIADPLLFVQDATQVTLAQLREKVDCIVTEPFLGKQNPKHDQVDNILKGLEKLYLGALKQWRQVLAEGGRVVMIWPSIQSGKGVKTLEHLVDRLALLGYTREKPGLRYTKPQGIVQREIMVFQFQGI